MPEVPTRPLGLVTGTARKTRTEAGAADAQVRPEPDPNRACARRERAVGAVGAESRVAHERTRGCDVLSTVLQVLRLSAIDGREIAPKCPEPQLTVVAEESFQASYLVVDHRFVVE